MSYTPSNWYWFVAGSTTRIYSSAAAAYVSTSDSTYAAWLAAGNVTNIVDSESTLRALLAASYPLGWPKDAAQVALDAADITMHRIVEAVALGSNSWTSADVVAWVEYRRALRQIIDGSSTTYPSKPSYPAGT